VKKKESGELVRETTFGGKKILFPISKVPRQCPLVLLVEVLHMIGINFYMMLERLHYGEILTFGGLY
jgi:hypothetical protein